MDQIHVRDFSFSAVVGIKPEERKKKQSLVLHLTLFVELNLAGNTDQIQDTVDYDQLMSQLKAVGENSHYYLLEKLATCLADVCLEDCRIKTVRLTLEKPQALPPPARVGITIERTRPQE